MSQDGRSYNHQCSSKKYKKSYSHRLDTVFKESYLRLFSSYHTKRFSPNKCVHVTIKGGTHLNLLIALIDQC